LEFLEHVLLHDGSHEAMAKCEALMAATRAT
jgi:hypothetical protein